MIKSNLLVCRYGNDGIKGIGLNSWRVHGIGAVWAEDVGVDDVTAAAFKCLWGSRFFLGWAYCRWNAWFEGVLGLMVAVTLKSQKGIPVFEEYVA